MAILHWHGRPPPRCADRRAAGRTVAGWRFSPSIGPRARKPRAKGCRRGWWRGLTAPDALGRWAELAGVGGVCIEHFLLHPGLVDRLRLDGLSVITGTVNDATLAMRAAALGVDAITTDRPAALYGKLAAMLLAA
jgi:glycerophosphoryl diester phosphodiesterase